jgi:hypothetical protein
VRSEEDAGGQVGVPGGGPAAALLSELVTVGRQRSELRSTRQATFDPIDPARARGSAFVSNLQPSCVLRSRGCRRNIRVAHQRHAWRR